MIDYFLIFILTSVVSIGTVRKPASNTTEALNAIIKASYVESGIDIKLKRLERKHINEDVRKYSGWALIIIKTQREKVISYAWKF